MKTDTQEVIQSLITPNGKTINDVFQKEERYFIDIYQRDYKWEKTQIDTLLRDVELRFNLTPRKDIKPKKIKEDIIERFKPYFLNTFLTSKTSNHISIVDGQQRLTSFLIIFIKLRQLVDTIHKDDFYKTKTISVKTLDKYIFESDDFDEPEYYKIYNPNRQDAFNAILSNELDSIETNDESQKRIVENYRTVSKYYDTFFKDEKEDGKIDVIKLSYYIYYILEKLNIVEIKIEQQENVATIFEVVNDRGLGLKPYEILKGKFLGNLPTTEKEEANNVWVNLQNKYYNSTIVNSTEKSIDLDTFFKIYLRAKFADSESDYKKFEDKYHYEIYQNTKILNYFERFENNTQLYQWVINEFKYFAELYLYLRTTYEKDYLIYNKLLDQNQQYLLILSSIKHNDIEKDAKIDLVSKKFDQLHTTVRLLDNYDSNTFQDFVYQLNKNIREKDLNSIEKEFDKALIKYLEKEKIISENTYETIGDLYKWELFKDVKNRWTNFSKYVLLRIDRHLADKLDKPSYCKESLNDLEERFNKNNRKRYGMHLEHIFAYNDKNIEVFKNEEGIFDEARFNRERNKLGVVLLLKDSQNISSNNDYYKLKVSDYATSNIIWNELLVGHIDSVDLRNLDAKMVHKVEPNEDGIFPVEEIENRQKVVFELLQAIWKF